MNNEREALKRAFIALYHMLIEWDISPSVAIDPPKRYPLNDEQIDAAWRSVDYTQSYEDFRIAIARAIERAHGIGDD